MDAYRASHVSFVGFPYFSRRNRKSEEMPRLKHKGIRHNIVQVHTIIFNENALIPWNILYILKKAKNTLQIRPPGKRYSPSKGHGC